MSLRGRRTNNFLLLWCLMASKGSDIWVSLTSFQKSNIGWPQQPPTEKVLKFNMSFHDFTKKCMSSKHQDKCEIEPLDDSDILRSDFLGLRTSAASLASLASKTSLASSTLTALFHQKTSWSSLVTQPMMQRWQNRTELRSMDSFIQILCRFQKSKQKVPPPSLSFTKKITLYPHKGWFFFSSLWNGSSQIQFFTDIWYPFCQRLLRLVDVTFFENWWMKLKCPNLLKPLGTTIIQEN